jgi:tRNA modification GTPase
VLHVADASQPPGPPTGAASPALSASQEELRAHHPEMLVLNKIDLGEHVAWRAKDGVRISCLSGAGIAHLEEAIVSRITGGDTARRDWSVAINARHQACLEKALKFADAAHQIMEERLSPEFVAEELRAALEAVGDVIGRVDADDVLSKIFSTFCIGK